MTNITTSSVFANGGTPKNPTTNGADLDATGEQNLRLAAVPDVVAFPLPEDLRLIALEYVSDTDAEEKEGWPISWLGEELDSQGYHREISEGDESIFGTSKSYRVRIDIVAARADAERWTADNAELFRAGNGRVQLSNWKVDHQLPLHTKGYDGYRPSDFLSEERCDEALRYGWDDPDLYALPQRRAYELRRERERAKGRELLREHWDEDFISTVRGWVKTDAYLDTFRQLKKACRGDLTAVGKALARLQAQREVKDKPDFLVEGLVPKNNLVLMLGAMEVGKGALMLHLACHVATGKTEYLGRALTPGTGMVVFLYGEAAPEEIKRRAELLCDGRLPPRLVLVQYDGRPLDEVLEKEVGAADVELLIVDPARKFFPGDEDNSEPVNTFLNAVGKFVEQKEAAAVIVHHLKRNSKPRSVEEVRTSMRGSQVLQDRPRVILTMHRIGDVTTLGVAKHNLDAAVMVKDPMKLRRDATTFRHVPVEGATPEVEVGSAVGSAIATTEDERVLAALTRLAAEGQEIRGYRNLFDLAPPELAGMSRRGVERAVRSLKEQRLVLSGARGELILVSRP